MHGKWDDGSSNEPGSIMTGVVPVVNSSSVMIDSPVRRAPHRPPSAALASPPPSCALLPGI